MKLRILALAAAAALLFSSQAFADSGGGSTLNNCTGISCNETTTNTATGGAGGNASNANANTVVNAPTNTNTATGGSVSHSGNSFNVNDVDVKNHVDVDTNIRNSNRQKQQQQQQQKASAHSYSKSEVENSGNSEVAINYERNTASAYAAPGAIGNNICRSGIGAGGQGPAIGLSFNFANLDDGCEARTNAQVLLNTANYFQKTGDRGKAAQYYAASDREICSIESIREKNSNPGELCGPMAVAQTPSASLQDGADAARFAATQPMNPIPN